MQNSDQEVQDLQEDIRQKPETFTWKSQDGLTLSGRQWFPARDTGHPTVLCIPGLSRNTRDFNMIADFLQQKDYHVIALDYRGRGDSDWDPEWQNYALPIEGHDIDDAISHLGITRFAVLGTSRGGMHAMAMTHRYGPDRMIGVILNDIGPHLEMKSIHRIAASIGKVMEFGDFDALANHLTHMLSTQFSELGRKDWLKLAGQLASRKGEKVVLDYDPKLAHAFGFLDEGTPMPDLWHLFEGLEKIPLLIIHGALSDLLSEETCKKMLERHPDARLLTVPDQGHAPLLWDMETKVGIGEFLDRLGA
jgi:pimeloyl-ACP methyl ester carboxylesterase